MNKNVLATVLLCFSLLLCGFPIVSKWEGLRLYEFSDLSVYLTSLPLPNAKSGDSALSLTPIEEPTDPIYEDGGANIPHSPPAPVNTMLICDDDACMFFGLGGGWTTGATVFEWANGILEDGDNPFWTEFSINFVITEWHYWESPNMPEGQPWSNVLEFLACALSTFPKPAGVDVRYFLTGQNFFPVFGLTYGDIIIISTWAVSLLIPLQNVWQHEASHLYGAGDHPQWDVWTWCIMNPNFLKFTRNWCGGCWSRIFQHKYRFG